MSSFRQALTDHPAPQRLGDVQLTFDQHILLGETAPIGGGAYATLVGIAAAAFALSAAALLVTSQGTTVLAALLAALAASCAWISRRLERRSRHRRRFVVHFGAEQLRLERPVARGWRLDARWIPFDSVRDVSVRLSPAGAQLLVAWDDARAGAGEGVAIDAVRDGDVESLYRFRRTLGAAFGLTVS